jgi:hypothetical protein
MNSQLRHYEACALLDVWQEVLGVLLGVDRISGLLSFRGLNVVVPPRELACIPDFEIYLGRRIRLLRTDIPHRPLCVRLIESKTKHPNEQNTDLSLTPVKVSTMPSVDQREQDMEQINGSTALNDSTNGRNLQ